MIEVNLLPGGKKGSSGGFSFSLPKLGSLFQGGGAGLPDPYIMFFAAAAIVGVGYMGWAFLGVRSERSTLDDSLAEQLVDSIRFADIILEATQLRARGDSIARRVAIIQDIDAGRFVWAHLLDEVAAAVPDFLWLREVTYQSDSPLQVRLAGRAGSIFAVTRFTRRLEASRFLNTVRIENMEQVPSVENPDDLVYLFELLVTYQSPPIDELETVPLFGDVSALDATDPTGN